MDRLAALAAFGRSILKWGNGRVLTPYRKRLNRLPISPWGPIAMGMKDSSSASFKLLSLTNSQEQMSSLQSYGTSYLDLALGIYRTRLFSAGTYQLVPITYRFSFWRENQHIASEPYANEHNCELQVGIAGLRLIRGETLNIHSRLREVFYARLILCKECDGDMRKAAISEEYAVASRLKIQRDIAKDVTMSSLNEVEEEFAANMNDHDAVFSTKTDSLNEL
eukprot:scaffold10655_cov51-Cyclotella_meneghiniana.AAC.4